MQQTKNTAFDLISVAKRDNNTKRPYLFVNPSQGKHVPVTPSCSLALFEALGHRVKGQLGDGIKVLVIAFAETATAIGAGVARCLPGEVWFMQTTREDIEGAEYLYFSEVHSHAAEQRLIADGLDEVLGCVDAIVFAEDEVTTGRTIRNAISSLSQHGDLRDKRWLIASILNGMQGEDEAYFDEHGMERIYLMKTDHAVLANEIETYAYDGALQEKGIPGPEQDAVFYRIGGYENPRRVLRMNDYEAACARFAREAVEGLKVKAGEDILVLGTEEFMYPAMVAAKLLEDGDAAPRVHFHATTRSPILTSSETGYPLHERFELESVYEKGRVTYVYNLRQYDQVLVLTDARIRQQEGILTLISALCRTGNRKITIGEWR